GRTIDRDAPKRPTPRSGAAALSEVRWRRVDSARNRGGFVLGGLALAQAARQAGRKRLVDLATRLLLVDLAHVCHFADEEVASLLEHLLLAEREALALADQTE